jgi:hypothetical protein
MNKRFVGMWTRHLWACGGHSFVEQSNIFFTSVNVSTRCQMDPDSYFSEKTLKIFGNLSFFPSVLLSFIRHNSDEVW